MLKTRKVLLEKNLSLILKKIHHIDDVNNRLWNYLYQDLKECCATYLETLPDKEFFIKEVTEKEYQLMIVRTIANRIICPLMDVKDYFEGYISHISIALSINQSYINKSNTTTIKNYHFIIPFSEISRIFDGISLKEFVYSLLSPHE